MFRKKHKHTQIAKHRNKELVMQNSYHKYPPTVYDDAEGNKSFLFNIILEIYKGFTYIASPQRFICVSFWKRESIDTFKKFHFLFPHILQVNFFI